MEKRNATICIYDEIGGLGISVKTIIDNLENMRGQTIDIRINSAGGDVFEGLAIYNAIKNHEGKTIAYIDGLACGIASVIAFATGETWMKTDGLLMICNVKDIVIDSPDMGQDKLNLFNKLNDILVDIYVAIFKKSDEEIRKMMATETWITAQEALIMGIIAGTYN